MMIDPATHIAMCDAEFAAGRASRDAEIADLQKAIDANWVTHQQVVAANKERNQLREQVVLLRKSVEELIPENPCDTEHQYKVYHRALEALTATEPKA